MTNPQPEKQLPWPLFILWVIACTVGIPGMLIVYLYAMTKVPYPWAAVITVAIGAPLIALYAYWPKVKTFLLALRAVLKPRA